MKRIVLLVFFVAALVLAGAGIHAQQLVGPNVNVISGISDFLTGDPFLRQQNEPSIAVSVRNPDHILAAANDYRTIDIGAEFGAGEPGATLGATPPSSKKEAWIGVYFSYDRGKSFSGGLIPGSPLDGSRASLASPVKGLGAGSDPSVVADTAGHFYVGFLAFTRGGNSKIAVARYTDRNDSHVRDTIAYDFTTEVDRGSGNSGGAGSMNGVFLDKLWMAVDHNRTPGASADACGSLYIAYTKFDGIEKDGRARSSLLFSRSLDCGVTWSKAIKLNQPSGGSPNIRNQGVYLVVDPPNGDLYAYWPDYYEPHLLMARSQNRGQTWTKPLRITANYPLVPYAQPSISVNAVDSTGQPLGVTFRSKSLPAVAIDGEGRHYVAIQEAVGPSDPNVANGKYHAPRITLRITKDPMGTWPAPIVAVEGHGPQVMPAILANNGLVTLMYYEALRRTQVSATLPTPAAPQGMPIPTGQSRVDDAAGLDPVTHLISGIDREMDVWIAQAEPSDHPLFVQRLTKATLYAFDPNSTAEDKRIERFFSNLPTNVNATTPFIGDYHSLAGLNFLRSDAPISTAASGLATSSLNATTATTTPWRWAMDKNDGPGNVHAIWTDTRAVIAPPDINLWPNFSPFPPACINPGSRNVNVYSTEIAPGIIAGSPQPFGRLSPRDPQKDNSTTFVVYAENRTRFSRRFRYTVQAPGSIASFVQFFTDPQGPLTVRDEWVLPYGTATHTVFAWQGSAGPTAAMRVLVEDISDNAKPEELLAPTSVLLNPDPNNPAIVTSELHTTKVSAPQQPGPQQPGTTLGAPQQPGPQQPGPQQPGPQQPGPQQPGSQLGAPQQPGSLVGDDTAQTITWTTQATGNVSSEVSSITKITNYAELAATHDFQLIAYRYLINPTAATVSGGAGQFCSINGKMAYIVANVLNPVLAPQQPGPQQPGPQQPGPQQPGTGVITFYVNPQQPGPQQPGPQQPGTALDDGTSRAPRLADEVQVTLIVKKKSATGNNNDLEHAGGPADAFAQSGDPTFDPSKTVHADIATARSTDQTAADPPIGVSNSIQAAELTIGGTPTAAPQPVTAGTRLNVSGLTLSNTGNQPANSADGNFESRYYLATNNSRAITAGDLLLSDGGIKVHFNTDLPAGGTVSLDASILIPNTVTPGSYYLKVITDQDNEVTEGSELQALLGLPFTDDNITTFPVSVLSVVTPDLVTCGTPTTGPCATTQPADPTPVTITGANDGATPSPARVVAGDSITVSPFAVENQGLGDAYLSSQTTFSLSGAAAPTPSSVVTPTLAPNQSFTYGPLTLTIPASTSVGDHNFTVQVDATNVFPHEMDLSGNGTGGENNNTVQTTLRVVNRLVAVNDSASTAEDQSIVIHVLDNEPNPNSATFGDVSTIVSVTPPSRGEAVITDAGTTITYTPNDALTGDDSFTYTISDGQGQRATATVTVKVNDRPTADSQTVATDEDTPLSIALTGGDQETPAANLTFNVTVQPQHGTLSTSSVIGSGSTITYTPAADYNGSDRFQFTVTDRGDPDNCGAAGPQCAAALTSAAATLAITVRPVNDAPSATPQSVSTDEDTPRAITLAGTDVETPAANLSFTIATPPAHGTLSGKPPSVTYTPNANSNGPDSFTFTVTDGGDPNGCTPVAIGVCTAALTSAAATVSITVKEVNDAPVANADAKSTNENTALSFPAADLTANDSPGPANESTQTLTVTSVSATATTHGTVTLSNGTVTYTPDANYQGAASFLYSVCDNGTTNGLPDSKCATGSVDVTVIAVSHAPTAVNDEAVVSPGAPTFINVLANDTDVDGDTLTIQSFTQPAHGSVAPSGIGLSYTPAPDFSTTDAFTYTVSDGHGGESTATVTLYRAVRTGDVVISEFRFRGAGDGVDQFIELYNNTDDPITVRSVDGSTGWSVVEDGGYQLMYLPNGTIIPARGHLLGTQAHSADGGPSLVHSYAGVALNRQGSEFNFTWGYSDGHQIPENSGIALFGTTAAANRNLNTRIDAVGFQTSSSLYRNGGGLTPIVTSDTQKSFVRRSIGFTAQNTFNNFSDFVLVSTDTALIATTTGGSIQPTVGAPGPEHFSAPRYGTDVGGPTLVATLLDTGVPGTAAPNQIRSGNVLTLRRTLTNTGATAISRIRLRIVDISTLGSRAGYEADLRATSATNQIVTLSNASTVDVIGAQLETNPPQPNGGGLNSGLEIPLAAPLAPGASLYVQFSLNVVIEGTYRFNTDVPISPVILPAPFLPSATANQLYTAGTLTTVGAASPTWTLVAGGPVLAQYGLTFNSNGTITGTPNAAGSIPLTVRLEDALTGLRAERSYFLNVGGPLDVSPFQPRGVVGEFFFSIRLVGGRGVRQFQLLSGALPPGMTFDPNTGLTGTPTATGKFEASFRITDCNLFGGSPSCPVDVPQQDITRTVQIMVDAVEQQGFGADVQPVTFGGSAGRSLAQVFTSGVGGVLDAIRLNQLACPTGTQITVNILQSETVAPFKPTGSPISTGTGYVGLVFSGPIIPLSTPVSLTPGLRLAFDVHTDTACAMLRLPAFDNYNGGDAFSNVGGTYTLLSATDGRADLVFRTMTQQDGLLYTTVPLGWHTATPLLNGKVLLAGPNGAAAIYDPATHTLAPTGAMRKSRQNHTATLLTCPATNPSCSYNGKVLITGGKSFLSNGTTVYESSIELFDPAANVGAGAFADVLTQLGGATPRARIYHTATRLDDGRVLIVGGRSTDGGTTGIQDAELFDPETMGISAGPLDTTRRWQHTATLIAGGKVLVAGGYTAVGTFTSAQIYDPATGQFTSPSGGGLHFNRGRHTATLLTSGKVMIAGGDWANAPVMRTEVFDPTTGAFSDSGDLIEGRVDAAAVLSGGSAYIAGGLGSSFCCPQPPPLASIERFDGEIWRSAGSMVASRQNLSLTALTSGPNAGKILASSSTGVSFAATQSVELIDPASALALASAPPAADLGQPYSFTLSVNGVAAAFHHVGGSLPSALTFDDGTGFIHGTVDVSAPVGTYQIGVEIVDSANPSRRSLQTLGIRVLAPLVIGTSAVPTAVTGRSFAQTLNASGGSGARTWMIISGSLPSGVTLARNGILAGNPTATDPGSFPITVQVTDETGHLTTKTITVNVGLPADESEWTNTFPYGGTIQSAGLAVDPGDANQVYLVAQNRGLFKTTDAGVSWTSLTDHMANFNVQIGSPSKFFDTSQFTILRMAGTGLESTLYGVTQGNVWRSEDQGATWTFSGNGITGSVVSLVVAKNTQNMLYAGTFSNGVYQSFDAGLSWTALSALPLASSSTTPSMIRAIAVDLFNSALIYVGTNDQGVLKLENGVWTAIGGTMLKRVDSLATTPDPSFLFAVGQDTSDGLFRLDLGTSGATWQKATTPTGPSNPFFSAGCCNPGDKIAIDPSNANRLYVATGNFGIWISTNGGASMSFQSITGLQSSTFAVATGIVGATPVLYAGTFGQGVYKSLDGGSDWAPANTGLRAINFPHGNAHSLAVDATNPSTVYAGSVARGFRSVDGGASWQSKAQWMLPGSQANSIATHQAEPGIVYVFGNSAFVSGANYNFWRSDNTGLNFQPISINTGTGNLCCWGDGDIARHPSQVGTMWVAASSFNSSGPASGVYKTIDGGATWTLLSNTGLTNTNVHSLTIDPANPDFPYLVVRGSFSSGSSTPGGVFKWNGAGWDKLPIIPATQTDQTFNPDQIVVNPANGYVFVTSQGSFSNGGLYRSTDGGATWSRVLNDNVSTVAVDPTDPTGGRMYVGTWNSNGFRRSVDGGATWSFANEGLPLHATIESIVLDPTNPYRLLLATEGGVWVRTFPSGGTGDLSVTKTAAPATVQAGQNVTYTIRVTNTGPSTVTGAVVTDPLPAGAQFVPASSSSNCALAGGNVQCTIDSLTSTQKVTLTIVVTATAVGTMTNTATVGGGSPSDPNAANDAASAAVTVTLPVATQFAPINNAVITQNDPALSDVCPPNATRGRGFQIQFDWSDVTAPSNMSVAGYELFAELSGAAFPILNDVFAAGSAYTYRSCNSMVADSILTGWHWRVRTKSTTGEVSDWSPFATFQFGQCRLSDGTPCQ